MEEPKEECPKEEMNPTCGWGPLTSRWLQRFGRMSCLAACLSFCSFFNGINYGALNVALTSLEQRYSLSSLKTGLIAATANIGGVITVLFLNNVKDKNHKSRMLACGALVSALSCVFRVLPHLLDGPYWLLGGSVRHPLCLEHTNMTICAGSPSMDGSSDMALAFLLVGQFLGGAGFSPVISLAPGLFADNSADGSARMYIAASNTMSAVGVAAGFLLGAVSLTLFVDISAEKYIDYSNPRWIGAWWLMFVVSGTFMFVLSCILFAFPHKVYIHGMNTSDSSTRSPGQRATDYRKYIVDNCKTLSTSARKLAKNPAFHLFSVCGISEHCFVSALLSFGAKFFEEDFDLSAADAGLLMGSILTAAAAAGVIGGSLLKSKLATNPRALARLCTLCILLAAIGATAYLYRCEGPRIAGVHVSYDPSHGSNTREAFGMTDGCNVHCGCHTAFYSPVCGHNGLTYFSACHAGCDNIIIDKARLMLNFSNCACVKKPRTDLTEPSATRVANSTGLGSDHSEYVPGRMPRVVSEATDGKCQRQRCSRLYPFFLLLLLGAALRSMVIPPLVSLIVGCVPAEENAFTLGVYFLSVKIFGAIPGPIVLGILTDRSCLLWQETCKGRGQCWVYNIKDLNKNMCFLWLGTSVLSGVLAFLGSLILPCGQSLPNTQDKRSITDEGKPDLQPEGLYEIAA